MAKRQQKSQPKRQRRGDSGGGCGVDAAAASAAKIVTPGCRPPHGAASAAGTQERQVDRDDASDDSASSTAAASPRGWRRRVASEGNNVCDTSAAATKRAVAEPEAVGPAAGGRTLELKLCFMSGASLAVLQCSPSDTVYEVKQRLSRHNGLEMSLHQLVHGTTILQDSDRLYQFGCDGDGGQAHPAHDALAGQLKTLTLKCVMVRMSSLAALLEEGRSVDAAPVEPLHMALADVADSVMQQEHVLSERMKPCAANLAKAIPRRVRAMLITWMVQAFGAFQFSPSLLYGTVLTLDRYCAALAAPMETAFFGEVVLAAICTEMKMSNQNLFPTGYWQRVIKHFCQDRYELTSILRTEHAVLERLGFEMGVPTSFDFFTGLSLRFQAPELGEGARRWVKLGTMLLSLALLDPDLQYRYSHAILAAGALCGGFGVYGGPSSLRAEVLEDLAAYRAAPKKQAVDEALFDCEADLLKLWGGCLRGESGWGQFFGPFDVIRTVLPWQRLHELQAARGLAGEPTCGGVFV
mmetsp:Transcript_102035/g.288102  ORF Transcript_102035/g.288102 Transcript_102035/m.288102 type:complete len:523 (+) Transcript_102035:126-1694(+)|eukprot:CAMPEP_0117476012 /NCGR_PEP_ID=MMETSP0784-20121206/10092_1 /TAXON_ID=39447 /ORGANISM="" /LENGTH=522 /DNA_ID=CAMNT_0005270279 /DNA_START=119 /DNA_END=1687 /DNA_ORIENTATION=+